MGDKLYPWKTIHIPDCLAGQPIVVGVDEAGRGPVLGPLVYSVAFWPQSEDEEISKLAFNDSKQLSHVERENLLNKLIAHPSIGYVIEEIDSVTISEVCISCLYLFLLQDFHRPLIFCTVGNVEK